MPIQNQPYSVDVEAGKSYFWCACGMTKTEPFCDGSHCGSGAMPYAYKPKEAGTVYFCGCRESKMPPLCDGSHKDL